MRPLNILFLADNRHPANALREHIDAYVTHSRHNWVVLSSIGLTACDKLDIERFDAIAIHYSVFISHERMFPKWLAEKVRNFSGLKLQFIQDEYRRVSQISNAMVDLGIHLLFTLVAPDSINEAYRHPGLKNVRKVSVLAGDVPEGLPQHDYVPLDKRPYDIIYRSREVPFWLGKLGQEKKWIADGVLSRAADYKLKVDVSVREERRIYGRKWLNFMCSGRCVLGTEGGASIWDFEGTVEKATNAYLSAHPEAAFEEVYAEVLAPYEGNMMYNTLSPRLFEAAVLRTPMVLFPGWYNGVVEADKHYIALEKDFSNFSEVVEKIRDTKFLESVADRAYQDLIATERYSKQRNVSDVDNAIEDVIRSNPALLSYVSRDAIFNTPAEAEGYVRTATKYQRYLWHMDSVMWFGQLTLRRIYELWHKPELTYWQRITIILSMLWKYIRIYATHYAARVRNIFRPVWARLR